MNWTIVLGIVLLILLELWRIEFRRQFHQKQKQDHKRHTEMLTELEKIRSALERDETSRDD